MRKKERKEGREIKRLRVKEQVQDTQSKDQPTGSKTNLLTGASSRLKITMA